MEVNQESIILGLIILVIVFLLLNKKNETFVTCTPSQLSEGNQFSTECKNSKTLEGVTLKNSCSLANGTLTSDGCGVDEHRCACVNLSNRDLVDNKLVPLYETILKKIINKMKINEQCSSCNQNVNTLLSTLDKI
jgi:hypothetical protein